MAKVLVSLVSDQTIPNVLFIKQFPEMDMYLFVTTERMEDKAKGNKREWIIKAAGIPDKKHDLILVDAERKEYAEAKLNEYEWTKYDEIVVNVTGGTKMMSIAAYEFFKTKTDKLWYLPIGKKEYHLCDNSDKLLKITHQTTVEEYLDCCGVFKNEKRYTEKSVFKDWDFVKEFYLKFTEGKKDFLDLIELIRLTFRSDLAPKKFKNADKIDINNSDNLEKFTDFIKTIDKSKFSIDFETLQNFDLIVHFIKSLNFDIIENKIDRKTIEFVTGGWFEEYVYYVLKSITKLDVSFFKLGVQLIPAPSQIEKAKYFTNNDLDVIFVFNNDLYVVECKSAGMEGSELYNKTVYLASALRKYFGLSVKSVLCTLSEMNDDKKEKAETLGITAIAKDTFVKDDFLDIIAKALKINK